MTALNARLEFEVPLPRPEDHIYPPEAALSPNDPVPKFGDDIWPVRFFSANPSMSNAKIHWATYPEPYRAHLKLATWALFNLRVEQDLLAQHGPAMRSTLSALRIYHTACDWRILARWMQEHGIDAVTCLTAQDMADYADYLRTGRRVKRNTAINHLAAVTRLWIAGSQIADLRLRDLPPWVTGRIDDYLPRTHRTQGENVTDPLDPAVISALLGWALRVLEHGAEPILEARRTYIAISRASHSTATSVAREDVRAYFEDLRDAGEPVPCRRTGPVHVDNQYIAAKFNCPPEVVASVARRFRSYTATNHAPVTVTLDRTPEAARFLPSQINLWDTPEYVGLLQIAAFIVIAYLTGMRPGEVLALETGTLHPSSHDRGWKLIRSRVFKTVRDADGNHDSRGAIRAAPWVAVAPVANAVTVLERIRDGSGLLFPGAHQNGDGSRSMAYNTAADRIHKFVAHINATNVGAIPTDPLGRITPKRFRRTLAWHIANQPGGLVALAIQYGHLRTAISEGYASRTRDGIQGLIDFETARAIAAQLSDAHAAFEAGDGVSGPSAMRFVTALREQAEEFGGIVVSERQAKELLSNPTLTVYRNDRAFVWCNFRKETARCLKHDGESGNVPALHACKDDCTNIATTDAQAGQMLQEADRLDREAEAAPRPYAERLRRRAEGLRLHAERHHQGRVERQSTE